MDDREQWAPTWAPTQAAALSTLLDAAKHAGLLRAHLNHHVVWTPALPDFADQNAIEAWLTS